MMDVTEPGPRTLTPPDEAIELPKNPLYKVRQELDKIFSAIGYRLNRRGEGLTVHVKQSEKMLCEELKRLCKTLDDVMVAHYECSQELRRIAESRTNAITMEDIGDMRALDDPKVCVREAVDTARTAIPKLEAHSIALFKISGDFVIATNASPGPMRSIGNVIINYSILRRLGHLFVLCAVIGFAFVGSNQQTSEDDMRSQKARDIYTFCLSLLQSYFSIVHLLYGDIYKENEAYNQLQSPATKKRILDIPGYLKAEIPYLLRLVVLYWQNLNWEQQLETETSAVGNDSDLLYGLAIDLNVHALQCHHLIEVIDSYLDIFCRPSLQDRDMEQWLKEICIRTWEI